MALFSILLFSGLLLNPAFAVSPLEQISDPETEQLEFIIKLYNQADYYRSLSEITRIKYQHPELRSKQVNLYHLKNLFQLKEYQTLKSTALKLLNRDEAEKAATDQKQVGLILTASFLDQGDESQAQSIWTTYVREEESPDFPFSNTFEKLVDPDQASLYSSIIPGSGLLLSRQYDKAAVSFLLNLIFIYGSYHAYIQQQYGISGLMLFFEVSWYIGGKKASRESATIINHSHIRRQQNKWMRNQLDKHQLQDLH